jgi:hypothetical protein
LRRSLRQREISSWLRCQRYASIDSVGVFWWARRFRSREGDFPFVQHR